MRSALLRGLGIHSEVPGSKHPPILADSDRSDELDLGLDLDLTSQGHRSLDDHFILGELEYLDPPDQVNTGGMVVRIVCLARSVGTGDREFDGTSSVKNLLKRALPFVGSGS